MPNPYFRFKQFNVYQDRCAMKVTTDACLFGAWCAEEIKNQKLGIKNCLDIGAGTGLLSLMVAQKSKVNIYAIEIDNDAAQQAKGNIDASPFKDRITIINGDVLELSNTKKYDIIISNPPFYEDELSSPDPQKNSAHHSSYLKLGELIRKINSLLTDDGNFFLLLPFKREAEIIQLLFQSRLFVYKKILVKQTEKHTPFRIMLHGCKNQTINTRIKELSIKQEEKYTDVFTHYLKDYYLYL